MRRLISVAVWFFCIGIAIKILMPNQPLGPFWLIVIFLSMFFGLPNSRKKEVPEGFTHQLSIWWEKYHSYPYYHKQQFLSETVNRALKIGQVEQVEKFLKTIINSEPDNEIAQSLLIGLWGTEVINKWNNKTV